MTEVKELIDNNPENKVNESLDLPKAPNFMLFNRLKQYEMDLQKIAKESEIDMNYN